MASVSLLWTSLDARRRVVVVLAAVAVFAAVIGLARAPGSGPMALLYSGLEGPEAGEVVAALDQMGTPYEVRGTAIFVPEATRDRMRMSLAAEGLPAAGNQGYELLDQLTGFGTTSQMFDAAYWRAKEGELARTIQATPGIRKARVHLSNRAGRPFARDMKPSAAVTVTTDAAGLATGQAEALRHLVAAAVSGLSPADVAVIDSSGGLVASEDHAGQSAQTRSEALRLRAQRLLEARVGPGNAVVELSLETITESEEIIERRIDPDSRTAISTETEERADSGSDPANGDVTVASNLPDGDAAAGGASTRESSETRSLTNYEISETSRELRRAPGGIRRLTVAVLVNEVAVTSEDGTESIQPRDPEELAALEALVSSAVGLDPERGDEITVRQMPFEALPPIGTEAMEIASGPSLDMMQLIRIGALATVALILGLFVVRPILASGRSVAQLPPPAALPGMAPELRPGEFPASDRTAADRQPTLLAASESDADPVDRLRRLIDERQSETIQILHSWDEDPDDTERA